MMVGLVQKGEVKHLCRLEEIFKPLVYSWLRKVRCDTTEEKEDYMSMAKIILIECCRKYDSQKNVPFASYYKISLYHWYGNYMKKKKPVCISMEQYGIENETHEEIIEEKENAQLIYNYIGVLSKKEQDILKRLVKGQLPKEIGSELGVSKKTVLNKKYIIIQKLRREIEKEYDKKKEWELPS